MVGISLGGMFNSGGKTVVSGGNSQLDIESIVKGLVEARRLPAVQMETKMESNTNKLSALGELQTILEKFQQSANFLRNVPGIGNEADNVFAYSSAKVTSSSGTNSYLNVTAGSGASKSSYEMTVDQLASKQVRVTNTFAAADASASIVGGGGPFNAGTLKLGVDGVEVELADGDSLGTVVSKVNAKTAESGVEATLIKVSDGNYRISFKSTTTGADANFDWDAENAGMLNIGFAQQTDGVDALVTIDGTQVSRASNTITDLVDGLSFELTGTTPVGTTLTVGVTPDTDLAKTAIMNFVDAYNEFRVFAAKQTATNDDGGTAEGAYLSTSTTMRSLISQISGQISATVSGLSGTYNSLATLGITLTDYAGDDETPFTRNILTVDEAKLDAALKSDFEGVAKVFEFQYTADNPDLLLYSYPASLPGNNITFAIDKDNSTYKAIVNGQEYALTATTLSSGALSLSAAADSPLRGLTVIYGGEDSVASINVTATQGLADSFNTMMKNALDTQNGLLANEKTSLTDRNGRLEESIDKIDSMIETYRENLLKRFSALESLIASMNSILQMLDAQSNARNNG